MPSTKYIQEVLYICLMIRSLRQVAMALGSVRDSPVEIAWSSWPGRAVCYHRNTLSIDLPFVHGGPGRRLLNVDIRVSYRGIFEVLSTSTANARSLLRRCVMDYRGVTVLIYLRLV